MKLSTLTLAVLATTLAVSGPSAFAQNYTIKLGGAYIVPNATSSDFSGVLPSPGPGGSSIPALPGVHLQVASKATLMFSIERAINDHFSIELVLGLPPQHDVKLKVDEGVHALAASGSPYAPLAQHFVDYDGQKVAKVKQMAPTLFFNYKYGSASDTWRPYLGLGLNYTKMDPSLTAKGEELYSPYAVSEKLSSSIAPAIQAGLSYKIDKNWSANVGWVSTFVSSTLTVTGNGRTHTAKFDFSPSVYTANVGYSF